MHPYVSYGLGALTLALGLLCAGSAFMFNRRGFTTRRTILLSYCLFLLFVGSLWLTGVSYRPSLAFTGLICIGGFTLAFTLYWVLTYVGSPRVEKLIDGVRKRSE